MTKTALCFTLLFFSAEAAALILKEMKDRETITLSLQEVASEAESRLPPCEGLSRLSEAALKYEPPRSCPQSRAFYEHIVAADANLRENCRELTRWAEDLSRDSSWCTSPNQHELAIQYTKRLIDFKKAAQKGFENEPDLDFESLGDGTLEDKPKGEFARPECEFPAIVSLQFRKWQLGIAHRHYGVLNETLDSQCTEGSTNTWDKYHRFLRGGEEAAEAK